MKKVYYVLLLISLQLFSLAQNSRAIDSLQSVLKTVPQDTNRVNALNKLGEYLFRNGDLETPEKLYSESEKLAHQLNFYRGLGFSYLSQGVLWRRKGNLDSALKYQQLSLQNMKLTNDKNLIGIGYGYVGSVLYLQNKYHEAVNYFNIELQMALDAGNNREIASAYISLGNFDYERGKNDLAIQKYYKALQYYEKDGYKSGQFLCLSNIGEIYKVQKDFQKALECALKAVSIVREEKFKPYLSITLRGAADIYGQMKKYNNAAGFYNEALNVSISINDKTEIASCYSDIGSLHLMQNQVDSALSFFNQSLKLWQEIGEKSNIASTLSQLGYVYLKKGKFSLAADYYNKSLVIGKELGNISLLADVQQALSDVYVKLNDPAKALLFYKDYIIARDSIYNEERTKNIVRAEMNYDFEKKDLASKAEQKRKDTLAAEKVKVKDLQLTVTISIAVGLAMTVILIFLFYRQNKLRSEQNAIKLEQKLLRSQMNPHFMFNALIAIESFIYKNDTKSAGRYLSDFARLMRNILENSREEYIPLEKEISTLENYLNLQRLRFNNNFNYSIHVNNNIDATAISIPPMLAQPFIENSIEHGLREKTGGLIEVNFRLNNNKLFFEVMDNGTGFNSVEKEKSEHKSLATEITKERLHVLNRRKSQQITWEASNIFNPDGTIGGAKVNFEIPYHS